MNILYVDQTAVLAGGELNLYDFLRSSSEGASVVLLEDGPFRPLLEQLNIPVTVLPMNTVSDVRRGAGVGAVMKVFPVAMRLRRRLAQMAIGFDLLYANSQKAFLLAAFSRRPGQPLVWHLHDMLVAEHFSKLLRFVAVFAGNRYATVVIVNSEATAKAFIDAGGRADKVRVVYCGLDPRPFDSADAATVAKLREEIFPGKRFVVGVFGRLAEWKGQHVLLDAVASLPDVEAMIVGGPFFGEDAYEQRLLSRAAQPDLAGRVHLLGFRKDIPELMLACDVIAHTSTSPEPFGRVVVEGMLARKPVIATRAGGATELIEDGVSGILTAPGSAAELAAALGRLQAQPALCATLALGGRERAVSHFSLKKMVSDIEAVLHSLPSS